jgi:predicted nicotinamide N-methyase
MEKRMTCNGKTEISAYGVRAFRSRHPNIKKLKRLHTPYFHGFRVWRSSWLLMDFFKHRGLPLGTQVMDVGCGWGLAGIYCAKEHHAIVTSVDIDSDVFPYMRMHADINNVTVGMLNKSFDELSCEQFRNIDVLIGADICFWDRMVGSLKSLICRALHEGVQMVVIADPGRSTFHTLGGYFTEDGTGRILDWSVKSPYPIQGQILTIASLPNICT